MPTIRQAAQVAPGGALLANQSNIVELFKHDGDVSLGTVSTDAEGFWEFTYTPEGSAATNWTLNPGPLYWKLTYLSKVRRGSTKAAGVVGANSLLELPALWQMFGDGVVAGAVSGDFAVTYDGAGLDVDIAAGYALVRGVGVTNPASRELNLAAANPTNPRIDTIVLDLDRTAGDTEGKIVLKVKTGTPAPSPVAPNLTQNTTTWQVALADARVNANATTVASITDRRVLLPATASRNPTLVTVARTSPGATPLTTTPTTIAALAQTPTLVSGVWYDIMLVADIDCAAPAGTVDIACFIDGASNAGSTVSSPTGSTRALLTNAHSAAVQGAGAAITCGVLASTSLGGTGVYYAGSTRLIAIPRS